MAGPSYLTNPLLINICFLLFIFYHVTSVVIQIFSVLVSFLSLTLKNNFSVAMTLVL